MTFVKGTPKPQGSGMKKGQTIKRAAQMPDYFQINNINLVEEYWKCCQQLEGAERADAIAKIFPYVFPKLSQVTVAEKTPEQEEIEQMTDAELTAHVLKLLPKETGGTADQGAEEGAKEKAPRPRRTKD